MVSVNEVKKSLDVCSYNESNCVGCVYREYEGELCVDGLLKDALYLIKRQEAEINRLKAERKGNDL